MYSKAYKLTDAAGVIVAAGSKKYLRALQKKMGAGFKIWNSPSKKVGDRIGG